MQVKFWFGGKSRLLPTPKIVNQNREEDNWLKNPKMQQAQSHWPFYTLTVPWQLWDTQGLRIFRTCFHRCFEIQTLVGNEEEIGFRGMPSIETRGIPLRCAYSCVYFFTHIQQMEKFSQLKYFHDCPEMQTFSCEITCTSTVVREHMHTKKSQAYQFAKKSTSKRNALCSQMIEYLSLYSACP